MLCTTCTLGWGDIALGEKYSFLKTDYGYHRSKQHYFGDLCFSMQHFVGISVKRNYGKSTVYQFGEQN